MAELRLLDTIQKKQRVFAFNRAAEYRDDSTVDQ